MVTPLTAVCTSLLLFMIGGCYSYHPAPATDSRLTPVPISEWPTASIEPLRPYADATPTEGKPLGINHVVPISARLTETGLVRLHVQTEPADRVREPWDKPWDYGVSLPHDGRFLSPWQLRQEKTFEANRIRLVAEIVRKANPQLNTEDAVTTAMPVIAPDPVLLDRGLVFTLPIEQRWPGEPVGLVVHLESMIMTKYELAITDAFERAGWAVAHLGTKHSIISDRWTEYVNELVKRTNPPPPFPLNEQTDTAALGVELAEAVDLTLAGDAYAAEFIIEESQRLRPQLASRPILVLGFSAGAMSAPTIAARIRERWPRRRLALLLVGGGADLLRIGQESTISDGGMMMRNPDDPPLDPELLDEVDSSYRASTRLDPLVAVAALRDIPLLHVYGSNDDMVPTGAARELNRIHGHADRLVYRGGHGGMFYFLGSQASRLISWANRATSQDVPIPGPNR